MVQENIAYFIVIDIIVVSIFCAAVSNGWKCGAVRSLTDFLSSIGKIIISGFGGYWLMKIFNPIPAKKVSEFLLRMLNYSMETSAPDQPKVTDLQQPELVEIVCKMICVLFYFILFMIILSAIERRLRKQYREREKKEGRTISLPNHITGAFMGFLLFLICTIIPCPALIAAQKVGAIPYGNNLVYKSFLAFPVNLAARPLTRVIAGEETDKEFWEDKGLLIFDEDVQKIENWWEEYGITQ